MFLLLWLPSEFSWRLGLGHLAALVGGLGQLLVRAGTAVTRLDSSKGALGVSAMVSATTVEVEGCTNGLGSSISSVAVSITFSIVAGVGRVIPKVLH